MKTLILWVSIMETEYVPFAVREQAEDSLSKHKNEARSNLKL